MHLEPVPVAPVLTNIAGGPGHVDGERTGVLHSSIVPQLEADLVAGRHLHDLRLLGVGKGPRIAAEVVARRQELLGRHDAVAVLAHVLPVVGKAAVVHQLAESVVRLDRAGGRESQGGQALEAKEHFDGVEVGMEVGAEGWFFSLVCEDLGGPLLYFSLQSLCHHEFGNPVLYEVMARVLPYPPFQDQW